MNKVVLMGRLTRDPEVRYSQGENPLAIARFTLAVDRRFRTRRRADAQISLTVWYSDVPQNLQRSISVRECASSVSGRIQTGSYTNRDGVKVYTTEVVVEEQEFAESKASSEANAGYHAPAPNPTPCRLECGRR